MFVKIKFLSFNCINVCMYKCMKYECDHKNHRYDSCVSTNAQRHVDSSSAAATVWVLNVNTWTSSEPQADESMSWQPFMCSVRLDLVRKHLPHTEHSNGFSRVCTRSWFNSAVYVRNGFEQYVHWNRWSQPPAPASRSVIFASFLTRHRLLLCTRLCSSRLPLVRNALPHRSHVNGFSLVCTRLWFSSVATDRNCLPQYGHCRSAPSEQLLPMCADSCDFDVKFLLHCSQVNVVIADADVTAAGDIVASTVCVNCSGCSGWSSCSRSWADNSSSDTNTLEHWPHVRISSDVTVTRVMDGMSLLDVFIQRSSGLWTLHKIKNKNI